MKIDNQINFKGISTNPLPRLTEDKKRELEYIKKRYEAEENERGLQKFSTRG